MLLCGDNSIINKISDSCCQGKGFVLMEERIVKRNDVFHIYSQAVILCLAVHIVFVVSFGCLRIYPMMYYNVFSVVFYIFARYTLCKRYYRLTVSMVHIEVAFFVALTTVYVGWEPGYAFYLIALCSLVYFCPYKNIYVPYFFSVGELILFICLRLYSNGHAPAAPMPSFASQRFYLYNTAACFGVILYAAYISNLSTVFARRELIEKNQKLLLRVNHDELTKLYTRNYLKEMFAKVQEESLLTAFVMADIDDFKKVNDTYGHSCGDYVLFTVSTIMKTVCSSKAYIARWGGEEFVLMFYGCTNEEALESVQNLRRAVETYDFHYEDVEFHITATFGISFANENSGFDAWINTADERMYYGKKNGKNTVISADKR